MPPTTADDRLARLRARQQGRGPTPAGDHAVPAPTGAASTGSAPLPLGRALTVAASIGACLLLVPLMGPITHNMSRPGHPVDEHGNPLPAPAAAGADAVTTTTAPPSP